LIVFSCIKVFGLELQNRTSNLTFQAQKGLIACHDIFVFLIKVLQHVLPGTIKKLCSGGFLSLVAIIRIQKPVY